MIALGVWLCLLSVLAVTAVKNGLHRTLLCLSFPAYGVIAGAEPAIQMIELVQPEPMEISADVVDAPAITVGQTTQSDAPRVLIYHTHTTEAYLMTDEDVYEASGDWRTHDQSKNVVAIGALLAELLNERYGVAAMHDRTDHEPPKLSSSYSRSVLTMQSYQQKYPTIDVFIDVHRDAYGGRDLDAPKDFITIDGKEVARLMFVVGTGEGATGSGFDQMPDFESNLALAEAITERLGAIDAQLTRPVRVKTGRYNQHVSKRCLLVEVGHNANTFEQAKNAVPYLAQAVAEALDAPSQAHTLKTMSVWSP